jgi:hypothetical protein
MQDIGNVREHMQVVGSDGGLIGMVDGVTGDKIKLTKDGPNANGKHHFIPNDWVEEVESDEVRLMCSAETACRDWEEESNEAAPGIAGSGIGGSV